MQEAKGKVVLEALFNINLSYPDAQLTNRKDKK
jgi:hypothetical protein